MHCARWAERGNCLPAVLAPFRHCCCRCSLLVSLLWPASRPSDQEDLFGHLMQSALQQASAVICRKVICAVNPKAAALCILEMCPLEAATTNALALLLIDNVSLHKIELQAISTDTAIVGALVGLQVSRCAPEIAFNGHIDQYSLSLSP